MALLATSLALAAAIGLFLFAIASALSAGLLRDSHGDVSFVQIFAASWFVVIFVGSLLKIFGRNPQR